MKSWQHHFLLGLILGIITVIFGHIVLTSIPGYDNDGNLLVTVVIILAYGAGAAMLGELLKAVSRNHT